MYTPRTSSIQQAIRSAPALRASLPAHHECLPPAHRAGGDRRRADGQGREDAGADSLSQQDGRRAVGSLHVGVWTAAACPPSWAGH